MDVQTDDSKKRRLKEVRSGDSVEVYEERERDSLDVSKWSG